MEDLLLEIITYLKMIYWALSTIGAVIIYKTFFKK